MTTKSLQALFEAMHHGKYEFDDFLHGDVGANFGVISVKGRDAYRPNKKLKAYHTFLNTFLCEYLDVNDRVVYSYRKGANVHAAVSAHAKSRAFFQTDLLDFFGSIDREMVRSALVKRSARVPISDLGDHIERVLELTTAPDGSLPVGFATSPPISNACLTAFDDELESHCKSTRLLYTRYSDDLVISAGQREDLADIETTVEQLLALHIAGKLKLNPTKSKLTTVGRKVKILGMVILPSGHVALDMDVKKRIEVLLYFYVRDRERFLKIVDNDMKSGIQQLAGYVNHVNAVDKAYLEKLSKKFGSTVIDSFLHRSAK